MWEARVLGCMLTPSVAAGCPPGSWGPVLTSCPLQGIFHFQLGRGEPMLHTRLRPHCKEFLEKIAQLYELHVFTFGSRLYAHTIAGGYPVETRSQVSTCSEGLLAPGFQWCLREGEGKPVWMQFHLPAGG